MNNPLLGYWTKDGGFRMNPYREAENHPWFRFCHDWWKHQAAGLTEEDRDSAIEFLKKTNWKQGYYQANISEKGDHFSRDNMWGIYLLHLLYGLSIKDLPVFKWNGQFHLHWNQWAVLIALKDKAVGRTTALGLILKLISRLTFKFADKISDAIDPLDTSGNLLWAGMKYFLWDELSTQEDRDAFRNYITEFGYWNFSDYGLPHPILGYIDMYEADANTLYVKQ